MDFTHTCNTVIYATHNNSQPNFSNDTSPVYRGVWLREATGTSHGLLKKAWLRVATVGEVAIENGAFAKLSSQQQYGCHGYVDQTSGGRGSTEADL